MPTGVTETHTVTAVSGKVISVASTGFSVAPLPESAWVVESASLAAQTFRVISVLEDGQGPNLSFTLTALAHNASKFANIDTGAPLTIPNVTAVPPSSQAGPATVTLTSNAIAGQVLASTLLTVHWDAAPDAIFYEVDYQKDNGDWQSMGRQYGLAADISHATPGAYVARVRATNGLNIGSVPTVSASYAVADQTLAPGFVADLGADAAAAQAAADAANATLANIASDNILSPNEKPVVIRDNTVITTE
jgi:predicted phage tail protein